MMKIIGYMIGGFVITIAALYVVSFIGVAIEGMTDWQIEHERCLKNAKTGYEIQRCR